MAKTKTKKPSLSRKRQWLRAAVVLAVVGLGAAVLPLLHAAPPPGGAGGGSSCTTDYQAPALWTSPASNSDSINATWSAGAKNSCATHTANGWQLSVFSPNTLVLTQALTYNTTVWNHIDDLKCNTTYTVSIEATYNGSKESPATSSTVTTDCGNVSNIQVTVSPTSSNTNTPVATVSWSDSNETGDISSTTVSLTDSEGKVDASVPVSSTTTSAGFAISCGTSDGYVGSVAVHLRGGSTLNGQSSGTVPGPACPKKTKPSNPKPKPGTPKKTAPGGSATHKGSGGTSGSGGTPFTSPHYTGVSSTAKPAVSTPPGAPTDFEATVDSVKVVELTWDAVNNADHYVLQSSTDKKTWTTLGTTSDTAYEDDSANFSTTYYYRVRAVSADGKKSGWSTAQVTTGQFAGSGNTITSSDKVVTITIPSGAFSEAVNCTVNSDTNSLTNVPKGQVALIGPYDLICVGEDGTVIDNFDQPLQVDMNLSSVVKGYDNINAKTTDGSTWTGISSTYHPKTAHLDFSLSSAKSFAAFGQRHKSPAGTIFTIVLLVLLALAAFFGLRWYRRRAATALADSSSGASSEAFLENLTANPSVMADTAAATMPMAAAAGAMAGAPACSHLDQAQQVTPQSQGCQDCEAEGKHDWRALRICLTCGHVGCSDDSPEHHAQEHYNSTGHPLVYDYNDPTGAQEGWCYIDQVKI